MFRPQRISFSSLFIPLVVALSVVLLICGALYLREANQISNTLLDNENRRMERFTGLFGGDVTAMVSDLRLLATGDAFQEYLNNGNPEDLDRAAHRAVFFSKDNPDYDKIRYIDEQGQEVLRVNHGGAIVPHDAMQNKGDRPFFQRANALSEGQIYLSAIDLNVENGAIEKPIKPTLRVAIPVFGPNGQHRGIYIINFLVQNSVNRLRLFVPKYQQRFRLLNSQGYWIAGERPEDEWGFLLSDRSGKTMAKTDPELWTKIARSPTGQEQYKGGYFTWRQAYPRDFAAGKPVTLVADENFLVFASIISDAEWNAQFVSLRQTFVVIALILVILTTILTWFFQARRLAQQERDRFFNVTRDMLCVAGFDGYFKRVNPAWEKALGYSRDEMVEKPFLDFVHPDDKEKTIEATSSLTEGGEIASFENRYRCKDGTYRWLLWSARPMVSEGLIYGSARDMTDRKVIEESLRQSEERNRSIIDGAYDAFISIDAKGRITNWNRQAEAIFGWTHEEVQGRLLQETIIPPKYREAHTRGMQHFHATGEGPVLNKAIELTALRKTGEEFPVEIIIWPLRMDGETTFHAFVRDITSRKKAEEEVLSLNEELKQRATLLEVANKELESFSYSVSHDLRAPLRHIHGFVELLQKAPAIQQDEQSLRQMGVIAKAAKEMGQLIDDLLAFSRTGRAEMHPVRIDMNEMVDQIIRDRTAEYNGRKVTWNVQPLPKVAGDPNLLRLVWTNLLDNALKYTRRSDETKIEIGQMAADVKNPGSRETVFYVKDNGVGFDMRYATKLFGVFQRLHRAEDFEGTGIGLANVQRIIHRHGGRIWAEAKVDSGATFYFSLPNRSVERL